MMLLNKFVLWLMAKRRASFCRTWTLRFWRDWRRTITPATASMWHQQLTDSSTSEWHRVIVDRWFGQKISNLQDVLAAADWLTSACSHKVFVTPRGRSSYDFGMQIWLSDIEDAGMVLLMNFPVVQVRHFSAQEFSEHFETVLGWMTK